MRLDKYTNARLSCNEEKRVHLSNAKDGEHFLSGPFQMERSLHLNSVIENLVESCW